MTNVPISLFGPHHRDDTLPRGPRQPQTLFTLYFSVFLLPVIRLFMTRPQSIKNDRSVSHYVFSRIRRVTILISLSILQFKLIHTIRLNHVYLCVLYKEPHQWTLLRLYDLPNVHQFLAYDLIPAKTS